jgi:hypothetical protein
MCRAVPQARMKGNQREVEGGAQGDVFDDELEAAEG